MSIHLNNNYDEFQAKYWRKQPATLEKVFFSAEDEVFQEVILIANLVRARKIEPPLKFYLDGKQINEPEKLDVYLPSNSDKDYKVYLERLFSETQTDNALLYTFNVQNIIPDIREKTRHIINELVGGNHLPRHEINYEHFIGQYKSTDGGIHKEHCANFQFVIGGDKNLYLWPEDCWDPEKEITLKKIDEVVGQDECYLKEISLSAKLDKRINMLAKKGTDTVFYWPAGWWHIGSSVKPSMSVSLAMYD